MRGLRLPEDRPFDIVTVGENSLDFVAVRGAGATIAGKQPLEAFRLEPGGQMATAALASARLGLRARYIGAMGDDTWASLVRAPLDAERVDVWESKDGTTIECSSLPQRLDGQIIGRVWSFRDVTERRHLEEQLRELSIRDPLTELYNRRCAEERLTLECQRAQRSKLPLAVALLDVDLADGSDAES